LLLQAVQPTAAIVSVGEGNRYGHPCIAVLESLSQAGVIIMRTDQLGTISMSLPWEPLRVTAEANGPYSGEIGSVVAFAATGSGGAITEYQWNFGDGSTGTGPSITHSYSVSGSYEVRLTVTGAMGQTDSDTATVVISPPPGLSAEANGPYSGQTGGTISLSAAGSGGPITQYLWSFGDGSTAIGSSVTHVYATAGRYEARLTVTGAMGQSDSDTAIVSVSPAPSGHVMINEVEQNPRGDDDGYEWVELYNGTSSSVDIGGWRIVATHGNAVTVAIPYGTTIRPNQFIVFYNPSGKQWIDNDGEVVELRDASSRSVDSTCVLKDTGGSNGDSRTWQRIPNGADTGVPGDWRFQEGTREASNG
jgi:PKD repeat protein